MAQDTKIEWADDTVNFWEGCTQISPACDFCYAMRRAARYGSVEWNGPPRKVKSGGVNLRASNSRGRIEGRVRSVFINSLSDIFDKLALPAWRQEAFDEIRHARFIHALILTKRIGNAIDMVRAVGGWPDNASLGITVINQAEIDRDALKLRDAVMTLRPSFVFLSVEPMLGPIYIPASLIGIVNAVICGGESGPDARPMRPAWVRGLRDQCQTLGLAFHFKQHGEWIEGRDRAGRCDFQFIGGRVPMRRVGKANAGRVLDGVTHDDFLPAYLFEAV